jgi:hypothetical protein
MFGIPVNELAVLAAAVAGGGVLTGLRHVARRHRADELPFLFYAPVEKSRS